MIDVAGSNLLADPGFEEGSLEGSDGWSFSINISPESLVGTTDLTDGLYHTVGIVSDPPSVTLYVDGEEEARADVTPKSFKLFGTYVIGSRNVSGTKDNFSGFIDDLFVARRPLTPDQVAQYHLNRHLSLNHPGEASCVVLEDGEFFTAGSP